MNQSKHFMGLLVAAALAIPLVGMSAEPAEAQSYSQYCQQRAERLSGYRRGNDVAGGTVKGAIGGAVVGSLLGGSKSKHRRRGAAAGALLGGMSAANRPNANAARIYRLEYEACMRAR